MGADWWKCAPTPGSHGAGHRKHELLLRSFGTAQSRGAQTPPPTHEPVHDQISLLCLLIVNNRICMREKQVSFVEMWPLGAREEPAGSSPYWPGPWLVLDRTVGAVSGMIEPCVWCCCRLTLTGVQGPPGLRASPTLASPGRARCHFLSASGERVLCRFSLVRVQVSVKSLSLEAESVRR